MGEKVTNFPNFDRLHNLRLFRVPKGRKILKRTKNYIFGFFFPLIYCPIKEVKITTVIVIFLQSKM